MARTDTGTARSSIRTAFKLLLYAALLGVIALVVAVAVAVTALPSYSKMTKRSDLGQMIRVHGADGTELLSIGPSFGQWLTYDQIPQSMRSALIAVEDRRFRSHIGVDPIGIARAIGSAVTRGRRVSATSTITQQLARNIFLTNNRSMGRKIKEGVLALALERKFSKDQILELYLNRVYFGGGAYGIDAASRRFFGHGADQLSLGEAAIIAGLVKAPSNYAPTADVEAARSRSRVVLKAMAANGYITPGQAESIDSTKIKIQPTAKEDSVRYFTDWALPQLDTLIDETSEAINVWTTLDSGMQQAAQRAIVANAPASTQGALVSLDRDGAVRAMVGGKSYPDSIYNRATQAQRQPGSAFKLFVYLTALESGMKPTDTMTDKPVDINGWKPRNSTRSYAGPVSLREAFARSINTISAQIGEQLGFSTIADMAHRFGITTEISTFPAMVLGTSDVRLIEMTQAFASVGNRGVAVTPYGISRVETVGGRVLYKHEAPEQRVLVAPWVAAEMTDLMQSAVLSGTGRAAQIGRPVAGKTGTTQSSRDGWFIGFSSGLTTGVWMGRDNAKPVAGLAGGTAPARAFHDFMVKAVAKRPVEQFETTVPMPDWELEPEESWFGDEYIESNTEPMVDADGNPFGPADPYGQPVPQQPQPQPQQPVTQEWLDGMFGNAPRQPGQQQQPQPPGTATPQPRVQRVPQPQPQPPRSPGGGDPSQPGSGAAQ
ncbi:PBP1A family penicillin-binding protein [Sphingomonas sabuli]|uniref:PBP1A family penicillin-binding protein n=1 Tax=Sphingomonas sabuli TaxID=2764186 RepID=A0A7G9L0G2_9SPHN|nr:PBP1A family penicillin-binding protein [Sphingomonas sabuli]QNM82111.1 PBP1A family penicillin-binding protein [Sphingomonas sabuli]